MHADLFPQFGIQWGLRYDFFLSPEGLDSFLTRVLVHLIQGWDDATRLNVLRISGVEFLLLNRDRDPAVAERVDLVVRRPSTIGDLRVYRVLESASAVAVVGIVHPSGNVNEAISRLTEATFDPHREVVLAGEHEALDGEPGTAELVRETAESLEVRVSAPDRAAPVVQRTHLPIYRASIDGRPTGLYAANLHRMGVKLPAGEHTVRIRVDRRYFHASLLVAGVCAALLAALALRGRSRRPDRG
jgi:hypothetical protein